MCHHKSALGVSICLIILLKVMQVVTRSKSLSMLAKVRFCILENIAWWAIAITTGLFFGFWVFAFSMQNQTFTRLRWMTNWKFMILLNIISFSFSIWFYLVGSNLKKEKICNVMNDLPNPTEALKVDANGCQIFLTFPGLPDSLFFTFHWLPDSFFTLSSDCRFSFSTFLWLPDLTIRG